MNDQCLFIIQSKSESTGEKGDFSETGRVGGGAIIKIIKYHFYTFLFKLFDLKHYDILSGQQNTILTVIKCNSIFFVLH